MFLTPSTTADLLIIAILGLIGGHTWHLVSRNRWSVFDPLMVFWGGVLVCYVEQPISYASTFIGWHDRSLFDETLFWVLCALAFVVAGYEAPWGRYAGERAPKLPQRLSSSKLSLVGYLLIGAGVVSYLYDMKLAGGAAAWLSVGRGGYNLEAGSAYAREFQQFLPVGIVVFLFQAEMRREGGMKRIAAWCLGGLMLWWFMYLGTRSRTIMFTMALLAAWYMPRRRNPSWWILASVFLGLWLVTSFQANYRGNFTNLSFNLHQLDWAEVRDNVLPTWLGGGKSGVKEELSKGAEFNCVMTVVKLVPSEVGYNYGYGHLEIFTRPIPRSFWPEKRYPHLEALQGVFKQGELTESSGGFSEFLAGPAFTFVGHWYYVLGPVGLAIGGLLTGFMFRMFREFYEASHGSLAASLFYLQLLFIGFNEATATPLYWLITMSPSLLALWVAMWWCREEFQGPNSETATRNRTRHARSSVRRASSRPAFVSGRRRRESRPDESVPGKSASPSPNTTP